MKYNTIFICLCLACFSCKKDNTFKPSTNAISFESPAIGQVSRYRRYVGERPFFWIKCFEYFNDTLVIEIIGKDENGWILKDYYTPGSEVFTGTDSSYEAKYASKIEEFYLKVNIDTITMFLIDDNDPLTWENRLFTISSALPVGGVTKFVQKCWKVETDSLACPLAGSVKSYKHLGNNFDNLMVAKAGCMSGSDGPDFIYAYSMKLGLVHFEQLSMWDGMGYGWNLIR